MDQDDGTMENGTAKLATTDRYLSDKLRPEDLERLDQAFGSKPAIRSEADRPSETGVNYG